MKFTAFLYKKLVDLLNDRRIVVWYDGEGRFEEFAASFNAPNCEVLSAAESTLKTRRRADEIYRLMNESENPAEAGRCMLIYVPRRRGVTEEEKMRDPFEVYALAGAAFGDTEDQQMESLARQAMPDRAEEITRLFREGRPTIQLLDGLEKTQRYPLLHEVLRTESPTRKPWTRRRAARRNCCGCLRRLWGSSRPAVRRLGSRFETSSPNSCFSASSSSICRGSRPSP